VYRAEPEVTIVAAPLIPLDCNKPAYRHLRCTGREFITLGLPMAGAFMAREAA